MKTTSDVLIIIVGLLHVWFMVLESFLWTRPLGLKTFKMTPEKAETTKVLAQNQGLYNLFLAAGLFWGGSSGDFTVKLFFLTCVAIAGLVGGVTAAKSILYVQALPAVFGIVFLILSKS